MFDETRAQLAQLGLPSGEAYDLPASTLKFPDGADFRIEVPTVNSVDALKALVKKADELGISINRVDDTFGIIRYTTQEIKEYAKVAADAGIEVNLSVGPRATYDTSATRLSPEGVRIGYRLRGMEQLVRAIEDVKRAVELGIRGILVYDEGLLWILNELRSNGGLPSEMHFKWSAHCGYANPAGLKVAVDLGADSVNPVRDLSLPMMASIRSFLAVPLDLHTDNPAGSGGFIRTYEAPEIVRVAAPVHLKTGNSALRSHGIRTSVAEAEAMVLQAAVVLETVNRYLPEARQTEKGSPDLRVPIVV